VVIIYFIKGWPGSLAKLGLDFILVMFLLVVLANVLYSLAYFPDIFVQYSAFKNAWKRGRWLLFFIGTAFAAIVARFISMGMFGAQKF